MLYIVATPIGNLDDISARAARILGDTDVIACEDTRRTRALLSHLGIGRPKFMISYREHTEHSAGERLLGFLQEGRNVVLCTDGGYPGISDPGYRLVRLAIDNTIEVQVIPGASAVPVALIASGLATSSYIFKGYPPRKSGPVSRFFDVDADTEHTLVIFESPFRVAKTLHAALKSLGDRQAAVCVELTKKYERISRGYLKDLCSEFDGVPIKGEVTIVIAGCNPKFRRKSNGRKDDDS
ncbi:MAG: 16S rRNA (cytidine(1402)-2'-O)-methyltransferase [Lentisphaerae bacterium]|nr:16S rRNA (cytidine(1402)-2'-O)-methyltransferase [Lentisphaerota bacterium]